jgi:excinuclease ABC subunit C
VADPATYRPAPGSIPEDPGVYRFRDEHGRVIYVGKAKSLRSRLSSYFADVSGLHPRTRSMVEAAATVDWVTVGTEVEALQLEYSWIKEFDPRFNVRYRDDKSYPYLIVTLGEEFPRAYVGRGAKRKGAKYFGPYAHAWAIRETLDLILRVFPIRTCSDGTFRRAGQIGRPCLLAYIDKCSAPCVGRIDAAAHRELVDDFIAFMAGRTAPIERRLTAQMAAAADEQDYESAARFRDDLGALRRAMERNVVVLSDGTNADVIGLAEDELEAAVEVFHVRDGRVRGQRSLVVERVEDIGTEGLVTRLLQQLYVDPEGIPRTILVPEQPPSEVAELLSQLRAAPVTIAVPHRGQKRALLETVSKNAEQALALHKARRAGDLTARGRALTDLAEMLELGQAPLRIECIDISHLGGEGTVGALVVFEDGVPRPRDYRTYRISPEGARDDTRAIHEVVYRRFRPRGEEESAPSQAAPRTGRYPPQLLVIDGGAPQVAAAARALNEAGVADVPVIGLAKRLEEVWRANESDPVILPRTSEGLFLLQRIRDEAHRSAIRQQRRTRKAKVTRGALDGIDGLGPARQRALLSSLGSVRRIRDANREELTAVPGIGSQLAERIHRHLAVGSDAGDPDSVQVLDGQEGE